MIYNSKLDKFEEKIFNKMKDDGFEYSHTVVVGEILDPSKAVKTHHFLNKAKKQTADFSFIVDIEV